MGSAKPLWRILFAAKSVQHRIGKRTQVSCWAYHQARQTPLMAAVMSAQYEGAAALVAAGALANHSDLTRPHPKWWFVWRIIPGLVILGFSNTCTSTQQERGWTCGIRANGLQLTLRKGQSVPGFSMEAFEGGRLSPCRILSSDPVIAWGLMFPAHNLLVLRSYLLRCCGTVILRAHQVS